MGAAIGLVWGLVVAYLDVPPFILTLGGLSVFGSLALVLSDNKPIRVPDGLDGWSSSWFGLRGLAVMLIVVLVLAGLLLHLTRFGRTTYAMGSSRPTAFLAGVPVKRHLVLLFVGNSTLAAFAGLVMMARLSSGAPRSGAGLELTVIAVTVLGGAALAGGRGTMIGTAVGVLVFGVTDASLVFLQVPGAYQALLSGGILIIAVVVSAAADLRAARATGIGGRAALRRLAAPLSRPSSRTGTRTDAP
jgi:ribose/xylose/arabinose/galactoside ABC-type transport system permease subunit